MRTRVAASRARTRLLLLLTGWKTFHQAGVSQTAVLEDVFVTFRSVTDQQSLNKTRVKQSAEGSTAS